MKISMKNKPCILLLAMTILFSSCASPGYGTLITVQKTPGNYVVNIPQNNDVKFKKEGSGSVYTILWLFSFGDASISSAMEDGNIVR